MVRLAHHERVDWVGLPRASGLGGLITNGWLGGHAMIPFTVRLVHHERLN